MTANGSAPVRWKSIRCPCTYSTLAELSGTAPIEIRRHCRRCKGWWIIDCLTYRVRADESMRETVGAATNGRRC